MKFVICIPADVKKQFDKATDDDLYGCYYDRHSIIGNAIKTARPFFESDDCVSRQEVIESICKQYTEHNAIVPDWLSIGDLSSVTPTIKNAIPMSIIEDIKAELKWHDKLGEGLIYVSGVLKIIDKHINETQIKRIGHWIRITNGAMKEKYICSECGRQIEDDGIEGLLPIKYPYCHCGAKMVDLQESEE